MGIRNDHQKQDRRAKRASKTASEPPDDRWKPPPAAECDPDKVEKYALSGTSRIVVRTTHYQGRLVDYAVMHEIQEGGAWAVAARIDCCHGEVHHHTIDLETRETDKRKVLRPLYQEKDVSDSFDDSYAAILSVAEMGAWSNE